MSASDLHDLLASGQIPLLPRHGSNTGGQNTSGTYQRDSSDEHSSNIDGKAATVASFQALIKKWEELRIGSAFDPTDLLSEMAGILEKVSI